MLMYVRSGFGLCLESLIKMVKGGSNDQEVFRSIYLHEITYGRMIIQACL